MNWRAARSRSNRCAPTPAAPWPRNPPVRWPRQQPGPPNCAPHNRGLLFVRTQTARNLDSMATQLDLQEQEQLDALKAFWNKQGNLITWTLVLVLGGFAAWNGWNWWQREQAAKAGALFEELDKAATAADAERT